MTPWAFTKLKEAEKCGRSFTARYLNKTYPFVSTPAMEEGKRVHSAMERRINDDKPLDSKLSCFEHLIPVVSADTRLLEAEVELGILIDFSPCSFYDQSCYFRGKLDVLNIDVDRIAYIFDWKTGKPYEDPDELNLHAMLAKAYFPDVKHWRGAYIWLKENRIGTMHTLSPAKTYRDLLKRIEKIDEELENKPRKNVLCPWCDLTECEYATKGIESKSNQKA